MSCAATSVSVSEVNRTPSATSPALRTAKFSTMPLWITASLPATCGCAFTSVGPPWVAQRVWPMAAVDSGSGRRSSSSTRFASLPAFFAVASVPVGADERDAGRVVPAVLEPPQALQHHVQGAVAGYLATDVADDSTHVRESSRRASWIVCPPPPSVGRPRHGELRLVQDVSVHLRERVAQRGRRVPATISSSAYTVYT